MLLACQPANPQVLAALRVDLGLPFRHPRVSASWLGNRGQSVSNASSEPRSPARPCVFGPGTLHVENGTLNFKRRTSNGQPVPAAISTISILRPPLVAEAAYEQMLTLPLFPAMTDRDVDDVVASCSKVIGAYRRSKG
jgi:hypothetical protein